MNNIEVMSKIREKYNKNQGEFFDLVNVVIVDSRLC